VPVFPAVVWVRVPASWQLSTVQLMATVRCGGGLVLAVLVTVTTDRPVTTGDLLWVVTSFILGFVEHVVLAQEVFPLPLKAVPVLSAVVTVRPPPVPHLATVQGVATVRAGCRGEGGVHTQGGVIAWPVATLYIFIRHTPVVPAVKQWLGRGAVLVCHTAALTVVEHGALAGVCIVLPLIRLTLGPIRQGVLTLACGGVGQ